MASGILQDMQKFYFFSQDGETGRLYMAEVSVNLPTKRLSAVFKTESKILNSVSGGADRYGPRVAEFIEIFKRQIETLIV